MKAKMFLSSPFFVFFLILLCKLYLARYIIFHDANVFQSALVELPSLFIIFSLIEWFAQKRKLLIYVLTDMVITSVYFAAIMYNKYFGVVVTYRALQQANQVMEVKPSVMQLLHPYFLFIFTDIVVLIGLFMFAKRLRAWGRNAVYVRPLAAAVLLFGSLALSLFNVSAHADIVNDIKRAEKMGLINYEIYTIFADMRKDYLDPSTITREAIEREKSIAGENSRNYWGEAQGRHLFVLQIEALQNFPLGLTVAGKEITPNLNRLLKDSYYFPHVFQMVGQGNTADAEFMTNTSLYTASHGASSQTYGGKLLPGLPKLLKSSGYTARTFHTNDIVFWNRQQLYSSLGFDKYYDDDYFGRDDIVMFGASDEVLYAKTVDELARLDQQGQKIYANIISMSSHHPFNLPADKRKIRLPEKFSGTFAGDYLYAVNYADFALGQFIDRLKQEGLWEKSMLFLYGDHMGLPVNSLTDVDKELMREMLGTEYYYHKMLNIPLIITIPGATKQTEFSQVGGQIDFMPTIANLLGVSMQGQVYFGQDLLNHRHNLLPERYYLPTGSFINDDVIYIPGESYRDGTTIRLSDGKQGGSREQDAADFERALRLLLMSDSYVNSLPDSGRVFHDQSTK